MFTGIIQTMGKVVSLEPRPYGRRFVVDQQGWSPWGGAEIRHGDSICVTGVCLTITSCDEHTLSFDVITETLSKTSLGELSTGDPVNLEPSVTPSQPMGGHFVQGHVEGVGRVTHVQTGEDWRIAIEAPEPLRPAIIPKGSIAIDGVSMTVAAVNQTTFEVAVIPTTLELTTLGQAAPGRAINIETDIISRTIVHTLHQMKQSGAL